MKPQSLDRLNSSLPQHCRCCIGGFEYLFPNYLMLNHFLVCGFPPLPPFLKPELLQASPSPSLDMLLLHLLRRKLRLGLRDATALVKHVHGQARTKYTDSRYSLTKKNQKKTQNLLADRANLRFSSSSSFFFSLLFPKWIHPLQQDRERRFVVVVGLKQ